MDILWVEDDSTMLKEGIFTEKYFNDFLTEKEVNELENLKGGSFIKVKRFLQNTKIKIFIVSNFKEAIYLIESQENIFDKIILDISLGFNEIDLKSYIRIDEFRGVTLIEYEEFIDNIQEEKFAGIILNHILFEYYEKRSIPSKEIIERTVFFTGNHVELKHFQERVESLLGKKFKYNSNAEKINSFAKDSDRDKLKAWLKEDEYSIILARYINSNASNEFIGVIKSKNSLENIRALFDTILKTIASEIERKKLVSLLEAFYWGKSDRSKRLNIFKGDGELNIKNFIKYLSDNKLSEGYNEFINNKHFDNSEEKSIKKERRRNNFLLNDKLNVSLIIQHALYSITEICNKYENHKNYIDGYTKETVETIHAQLKQIIVWFGQVMEEIDKK